ncbi:transcriptional regulator CtsR [Kurthia zopfii]|uniref:Transcriptional regulator CtsR n=1 Tax=Kurthia zopfii TaxID=1650 RepID=A0A2U3AC75_9BACL|nr:CtsR family transcriptional regulator [Kurthia zopfii]PWI22130.1 CtsR family transcriptional regulator [Kurthia zopfii]TDR37012.1 transcriptional regulator CtsR [Kurthia zopfii]STX11164.1 Class three stress gene repressor [Kurthia zopfii]VEI05478.1 Class three stress gene repressor [Kurthia zopfii]GEK30817.1 transcriptional regulator CtsR [Kurthia zopfii]
MKNMSNIIEQYLKEIIEAGDSSHIEIKRSEIADRFQCVPSQINYVINTRFTAERGYIVESKRGGGGYIRILRVRANSQMELIDNILDQIGRQISQTATEHIVYRLLDEEVLTKREAKMILAAVNREVIAIELPYRDQLRARIVVSMLTTIKYEKE